MKNLLFIACLFICTTLFAQDVADSNVGAFEFKTEVIDYGIIQQNTNGNRSFTFKNVGKSPIIITSVKGSCGCTVATKPNKPIMPGETAIIGVAYATNRVGAFSKSITITSNAGENIKVLRIKGNVQKANTQIVASTNQ